MASSTREHGGSVAETLRRLRQEREWSQRELAKHSGLSHTTISRIEAMRLPSPSLAVLVALANALRVPTATLLDRVPDERSADALTRAMNRALIGRNPPDRLRIQPMAAQLRVDAGRLHARRLSCDFTSAAADFPRVFGELSTGADPHLLSMIGIDGVFIARGLGAPATSWISAMWARRAAAMTRLPEAVASAAFSAAFSLVQHSPERAIAIADEALPRQIASPGAAAATSLLHLVKGLAFALTGSPDCDHAIQTGENLWLSARRAPDTYGLGVGPTSIRWFRMAVALARDDLASAAAVASQEAPRLPYAARAAWQLQLAELYLRLGRHELSMRELLSAVDAAPQYVYSQHNIDTLLSMLSGSSLPDAMHAELAAMKSRVLPTRD